MKLAGKLSIGGMIQVTERTPGLRKINPIVQEKNFKMAPVPAATQIRWQKVKS